MVKKAAAAVVLLGWLLAAAIAWPAAAAAGLLPGQGDFYRVISASEEPLAKGALLVRYELEVNGRPVRLCAVSVDLKSPNAELRPLIGVDGTLAQTQTVSQMAGRTGAVAAVNGGFFIADQAKPLNTVVDNGKLISSPIMRSDMPTFGLTLDGRPVMDFFTFSGEVKAADRAAFPLFGVNKLFYVLEDGTPSGRDRLVLYDRYWGPASPGCPQGYEGAVEAVVEKDTVTKVVYAGEPLPIPAQGYILWGHGLAAEFLKKHAAPKTRLSVAYETVPDYKKLKLSAGSNSFLVKDGRVAPFQENLNGKTARTAVASAGGGRYLYLVAAEKSAASTGLEQDELARLLVAMGADEALNLDGGGSAVMVARRLGDTELTEVVTPRDGKQRRVPDGIGVYNIAPPGRPAGLLIEGPKEILAGAQATYTVKGYDSNYHPWRPPNVSVKVSGPGRYEGGRLKAQSPGDITLEFSSSGVKAFFTVHAVGRGEIAAVRARPAAVRAKPGEAVPVTLSVVLADGRSLPLDPSLAAWEVTPAGLGRLEGGAFCAGREPGRGALKFSYEGACAEVPVFVGNIFSDTAGNWAENQIEELAAAGVVQGYPDGTYRPAEPVTRAQVLTLLSRVLGWEDGGEAEFADEVPKWAQSAVAAAVRRGVVKGYPDGRFCPHRPVTRAEVAVILDRALKLPAASAGRDFADAESIPAWAAASLERAAAAGIIRGYENGELRPAAAVTRAEMAVLIKRMMGLNYIKVEN